jgi:hypothetical protein
MEARNAEAQYEPFDAEQLGLQQLSELQLTNNIFACSSEWDDSQHEMVVGSYNLASLLHKDDTHRDMPYIFHLLRSTNRVINHLQITDPEIISALLLHDSVEDHPEDIIRFGAVGFSDTQTDSIALGNTLTLQNDALGVLNTLFSPRVSKIVSGMTNQPKPEGICYGYDDWLQGYLNKIELAIEDPDVWVGKIGDWGDNGLGIIHSEYSTDSPQYGHLMSKYGRLLPMLEERFFRPDIQCLLRPEAIANVTQMFVLGRQRLMVSGRTLQ